MPGSPRRRRCLAASAALLLLAWGALARAQPESLSARALGKIVERARPFVLRVHTPPGGTAVLIGVGGELLAPALVVKGEALEVQLAGERRSARLLERLPEIGLALLALEPGSYPAAPAGSARGLRPGSALVGLYFDRRGALALSPGHFGAQRAGPGGVVRLRTDVDGPAGTALFNARGELVALHAGPPFATVPLDEVRARLAAARPP